jgi:Family of unknown function (DUF5329)
MNRKLRRLLIVTILLLAWQPALAGLTPQADLLAAVRASDCDFYRNGSWHDSRMAAAHLQDKYQWLAARGRIATTEEFIESVATRSSLTGRAYAVRCGGGKPLSSNVWMGELLRRLRAAAADAPR